MKADRFCCCRAPEKERDEEAMEKPCSIFCRGRETEQGREVKEVVWLKEER